jgi:cobalt-zinc-cadmium efflux system membrane fusion protein
MYVEGRIIQDEKLVFAIPEDAVIMEGQQASIFILDEDRKQEENKLKFKMVPVTLGITDLGFVEINLPKAISEKVKIVTKGAYTLSSEMLKGELEHKH